MESLGRSRGWRWCLKYSYVLLVMGASVVWSIEAQRRESREGPTRAATAYLELLSQAQALYSFEQGRYGALEELERTGLIGPYDFLAVQIEMSDSSRVGYRARVQDRRSGAVCTRAEGLQGWDEPELYEPVRCERKSPAAR